MKFIFEKALHKILRKIEEKIESRSTSFSQQCRVEYNVESSTWESARQIADSVDLRNHRLYLIAQDTAV